MSNFDQLAAPGVRKLQPYQPGLPVEELERKYGVSNAVKLASNENPLGPSPRAVAAMRSAVDQAWLYPDGNGFALKQKLAERLGVPMEALTLGNGSSDVLEFALRAFVTAEHEVLFSEHSFAIYPILTLAAGAKPVEAPAKNWGHDLEAMHAAVTERTRLVYIANPNNPTGTWLDAGALQTFIGAVRSDVIVVLDEAYYEYASHPGMGADGYPDTVPWIERYPNLVVTRTFSKCYGLAGMRVGYAVSNPSVADLMNRVRPPFNVNLLALEAASAALDDEDHLARSLEMNREGMAQLTAAFAALGLSYIPSVGNFVSADVGRPAGEVYEGLLREGVIVRPVANYGMPNHLRVTVGQPEENERFIAALKRVLGL